MASESISATTLGLHLARAKALSKVLRKPWEQVGKISVNDFSTYVAVDRRIARDAEKRLSAGRIKGKSVKVRLL